MCIRDSYKFVQYIFFRQWDRFHRYCNKNGIQPVSYTHLDVYKRQVPAGVCFGVLWAVFRLTDAILRKTERSNDEG